MKLLLTHLAPLAGGLLKTLELTALAFPLAVVLGTLLGVCRVGPLPPLRAAGALYVHLVRNSPLFLVLFMMVFALPYAGVRVPLFWSSVIGLALYFGSYVCETFRSGVHSIPVGEIEAAQAIGLGFRGVLRTVVLPQAFRAMVQPLGNVCINVALASALATAFGVLDLTGQARAFNAQYAQPIASFVAAGIGYLLVTLTVGAATGLIERKVRILR
ncbi:amino acid ABC transporter permease [Streptomyces sp. TS71-3]|uniref:amino acid ABC transporter permease n=1 Tax=Streptomyces sp. TS71-3 TaxID=2733862 RepID=UPI001B180EFE|nr:amino acid ABC transporter permease [Streptomyces sp. TS71-3]GHJ39257.1 amino acid ABC transporter permease [Streptomyces sp. TS71-3]